MNEEFKLYVENNPELVSKKSFDEFNGLYLLKYKKCVFFKNLWNDYLKDCRGTVVDQDFNIMQYGFSKVFNCRENNTTIPLEHQVLAIDKINGFLAAVTWYNDDILISTTGSLSSDFVEMARELLPLDTMCETLKQYQNYTFCFEIVHPNDPHIILEHVGVYLIGARLKQLGSAQMPQYKLDDIACDWGVFRPEYEFNTFARILDKLKTYKREGFVVYDQESNTALKLKSPYYLTSKFIARTKKLDVIFDRNYKQHFNEEFYSLCEFLQQTYTLEQFLKIPEQERLDIIRFWAENAYA